MSDLLRHLHGLSVTRREFLARTGMGFASLGLAGLMAARGELAAAPGANAAVHVQQCDAIDRPASELVGRPIVEFLERVSDLYDVRIGRS